MVPIEIPPIVGDPVSRYVCPMRVCNRRKRAVFSRCFGLQATLYSAPCTAGINAASAICCRWASCVRGPRHDLSDRSWRFLVAVGDCAEVKRAAPRRRRRRPVWCRLSALSSSPSQHFVPTSPHPHHRFFSLNGAIRPVGGGGRTGVVSNCKGMLIADVTSK